MALRYLDRVRFLSSTTGTGSLSIGSAVAGFISPATAGMSSGDTAYYTIEDGTNWEVGLGTLSGSSTFVRSTIYTTSAGTSAAISLSGNEVVYFSWAGEAAAAIVALITTETTRAEAAEALLAPLASPALTGTPTMPNINGTAISGNRNRIINGTFVINQRAYVSGTSLASGSYAHDRWKAGSSGCTYTFTQSSPDTTITITAGSLQQVIEGGNIEGGTYTLSWTGTAQGRVGSGSYAASPVTVTGLTAGANTTIEFNTGTLGKVQFESGSTATVFERRMTGLEGILCQRYFQAGSWNYQGYMATGAADVVSSALPVGMRTTPTLTYTVTSDSNVSVGQPFAYGGSAIYWYVVPAATGAYFIFGTYTLSAEL